MKKLIGVIILLGCSFAVFSQAAFIRSGSGSTTTYRSFDSVIANYQQGDTVYLPGGTFAIGTATIPRKVIMYGAGHYPDSAAATGRTVLNGSLRITNGASGSIIQGFYLSGNINLGTDNNNSNITGLVIQRCSIAEFWLAAHESYTGMGSNIMLRESVVRSYINFRYAKDVLIENCLINGGFYNFDGSVRVANCIVFGSGYSVYYGSSSLFENNIFYMIGGFQYNSGSNTYRNNIFKLASPLIGSDVSEQNLFSVSNLFVQPSTVFDYGINFHLAAGSPAIGAGKGGTDCGIYGGGRPYKEAAVPSNPHVRSKTIADNTNASGQLQVQATVVAQGN